MMNALDGQENPLDERLMRQFFNDLMSAATSAPEGKARQCKEVFALLKGKTDDQVEYLKTFLRRLSDTDPDTLVTYPQQLSTLYQTRMLFTLVVDLSNLVTDFSSGKKQAPLMDGDSLAETLESMVVDLQAISTNISRTITGIEEPRSS